MWALRDKLIAVTTGAERLQESLNKNFNAKLLAPNNRVLYGIAN
jgi:hypothetical protein